MAVATAITVTTILGFIGSGLAKVAEGAVNIIKIVASIIFATVFASAVVNLFAFLGNVASLSIVGEVIGIVSMCLPFNAFVVFSGLYSIIVAILAFLVGRRVYILTMGIVHGSSVNA